MELLNLIQPGTTLLTPNRRLAALYFNQFNQQQILQKKLCWQSVDILPLSSWLQRLWQEFTAKRLHDAPVLLTPQQQTILWEIIIRQSPRSDALLQISSTAELAESAYGLLKLWQVSLTETALQLTEDGRIFQEWAEEFTQLCQKNHWLDLNSLPDLLRENILTQHITLPTRLILVGFTEISPQHVHLLNLCEKQGSEIIHYHAKTPAISIKKIALLDQETEIRTMARWAKATYNLCPQKRPYLIGCVVPQLDTLRETVLHIFSEIFTEDSTFTLDHTQLPFNISAGKSLLTFPIIQTAIELLKVAQHTLSLETISHLLKSPFLGEAEQERLKRAYFENRLRSANVTTLSIKKLLSPDSRYQLAASCPLLAKRLEHYLMHFAGLKKALPLADWATHFLALLKLLGWPGERSLNSQEYQIVQRWLDLLLECSMLDGILPPQTLSQALNWLTHFSAKTIFQPQTPEAPIQILGVLEAAELPFEHLWVMGFDDANWPASPKPNPLIPQRLQKTLNMPHATIERELLYCERLVEQLKHSATTLLFSYPEKNADADLRPSALLSNLDAITINELQLSETVSSAQQIFAVKKLENFMDENATPIQATETIRGGSHIFKQQAACPFKALTELRLHARFIDAPQLGLRALDRGNIVHKALELIWKELGDSTRLVTKVEPELKQLIHHCAKEAIQQTIELPDDQSNKRYLALELQRLEKILFDWLQLESQRPEFKVLSSEQEREAMIGPIPITLRLDRIDELADGSQLIIDYKTGKNNTIKKWFSERPEEPQIPLYCLISGENIAGIAFGQLHPDHLTLTGVSKKNLDIKSIKTLPETSYASATLWDQQLQEWKRILEKLSHDFLNGVARVDPKDLNVCNHCNLHTFCRVHEKC